MAFSNLSKKQTQLFKFSCAVVVVLVIALVIDVTKCGGSHNSSTLRFVIVVTRHGTRAPYLGYPKDPYSAAKYWPDGKQALTSVGKMQLYNVGTTLRQLYDGFLNTHYISSEFKAYSTLIERTLQSAEALLAGLYPPKDYQLWNKNIPWQPIPVYPNYLDKQSIAGHPMECYQYWKLQNDTKQALNGSLSDLKLNEYLFENTGINITSLLDIYRIWDTLNCEEYNGMKLPEWTKKVYPSPVETIALKIGNVYVVGNDEMIRLLAGPMLQSFIDSMQKVTNNTENKEQRMLYYSSHDHTLKALWSSFGYENTPNIKFAQTLLLELHSHPLMPSGYEVKLFQIDGTSNDRTPRGYDIPNCTSTCDFNQFVQLTKRFTLDIQYWEKECNNNSV